MFEFLIALSGCIAIIAAALAVVFGYRGDTCKAFGLKEEEDGVIDIITECKNIINYESG